MNEDSTVVRFPQPEAVDDPLTAVLRAGARRLLAQAIEAEAETFLAAMADQRLADGRARVVRHGHGPERTVQTGIGPVEVRRVKVRDRTSEPAIGSASRPGSCRAGHGAAGASTRCCRSCTCAGSTGDFQEALAALLGEDAPNLSPSVIARLKERLAGRVRALAEARPGSTTLRLCSGDGVTCRRGWNRKPSACW